MNGRPSCGCGIPRIPRSEHDTRFRFFRLRAVVARVVAAGGTLMACDEPIDVRPGTYLPFLRDPEGHIVEYADIFEYRTDLSEVSA